jgi:hypothetical protein
MPQPTCSGCQVPMVPPRDGCEIAVGWTVVRFETHGNITLSIGYLYMCPNCTFNVVRKQTELTGQEPQ